MVRTLLLALALVFSSHSHAADKASLLKDCQKLLSSLQAVAPRNFATANTTTERNPLLPWSGRTENVIETGQALDPTIVDQTTQIMKDITLLMVQLRENRVRIPFGLRGQLVETMTRATSAYLSYLNIPHSVEQFTNVLGMQSWRIKITPSSNSEIPIVQMANALAANETSLQFDFSFMLAGRGAAGFVPGPHAIGPLHARALRFRQTLTADHSSQSRLLLPIRIAYLPEAVNSTMGVLHEVEHWETSVRQASRKAFPFYGQVRFPFGIKAFLETDAERDSLFARVYGRNFSLDENQTMGEGFISIRGILDDPLSIINRESDENLLALELATDVECAVMATKLTRAVADAVLSTLNTSPDQVKITVNEGMVWATVLSTLKPNSLLTGFVLMMPLVATPPDANKAEQIAALRGQIGFMLENLPNREVLARWLQAADRKYYEQGSVGSYKEFMRPYLDALIPPGLSDAPDFRAFTESDLWANFHRATSTPE